ncbi:MAG: acyltransferase family protein [Arenicella sp.]
MQHYHYIQYLRGLACLLVIFHHAQSFVPQWTDEHSVFLYSFEYLREWGKIGVDIFFIISGFIITKVLLKTKYTYPSTLEFIKKRFIRVVPLYWFYTGITIMFAIEFTPILSIPFNTNQLFHSFSFLPEIIEYRYQLPILPVGWTLSIEIIFYLSAGITAYLCKKHWIIGLTIILISFHCFHHFSWLSLKSTISSHYLIEFIIGVWIAKVEPQLIVKRQWVVLTAVFSAILLFTCILIKFSILLIGLQMLTATLLVFSAVFAAHLSEKNSIGNENHKCHRFFSILGDSSYTAYLSHPILLGGLNATIIPIVYSWFPYPNLLVLFLTIISVFAGIVAYKLIEQPLLVFLKRTLFGPIKIPNTNP